MSARWLKACLVGSLCALACVGAEPVLAAVPSTGYLIVPGHSIGKVTIGEGTGFVVAAIGGPRGRSTNAGPGWLYGALEVLTDVTQLRVVGLVVAPRFAGTQAQAARYVTRSGIHVGSTLTAVRRAYPRARCSRARAGCVLSEGTRTTTFSVAKGANELAGGSRVIAISIG